MKVGSTIAKETRQAAKSIDKVGKAGVKGVLDVTQNVTDTTVGVAKLAMNPLEYFLFPYQQEELEEEEDEQPGNQKRMSYWSPFPRSQRRMSHWSPFLPSSEPEEDPLVLPKHLQG